MVLLPHQTRLLRSASSYRHMRTCRYPEAGGGGLSLLITGTLKKWRERARAGWRDVFVCAVGAAIFGRDDVADSCTIRGFGPLSDAGGGCAGCGGRASLPMRVRDVALDVPG